MNPFIYIFLISWGYWLYLAFSSNMTVQFDSIGYEQLGALVASKGWVEYFRTGPHREPLYPLLISLSMKISGLFSCPYYKIQTAAQLIIFGLTQFLAFLIMRRCKIRTWIIGATLLYVGFSPALVNTALSLYSEILTYPFVLGIILVAASSFKALKNARSPRIMLYALLLGGLFTGITLVKGIYEYIFYFVFLFFLGVFWQTFRSKKQKVNLNSLSLVIIFALSFNLPVIGFKAINKKYNGIFALTDSRADYSLYASAARRTEPLTGRQLLAAIAYTPGEGACRAFFNEKECYFWGIQNYDSYGLTMLGEVSQTVPKDQVSKTMRKLSLEKILERPLQFTFLMGLETIKMFFWESTKIGFVDYPPWLTQLYDWIAFKNSIRLFISLLSLLSFFYLLVYILRHLRSVLNLTNENGSVEEMPLFLLLIIFLHIGLYALFMTIPRFALPIAPLYLVTIAFAAEHILPATKMLKRV